MEGRKNPRYLCRSTENLYRKQKTASAFNHLCQAPRCSNRAAYTGQPKQWIVLLFEDKEQETASFPGRDLGCGSVMVWHFSRTAICSPRMNLSDSNLSHICLVSVWTWPHSFFSILTASARKLWSGHTKTMNLWEEFQSTYSLIMRMKIYSRNVFLKPTFTTDVR